MKTLDEAYDELCKDLKPGDYVRVYLKDSPEVDTARVIVVHDARTLDLTPVGDGVKKPNTTITKVPRRGMERPPELTTEIPCVWEPTPRQHSLGIDFEPVSH